MGEEATTPFDRLFQIIGVDLPWTVLRNHYLVMFQDFLSRFLHCVDVLCDEPVLLKTSDSFFGTKTMIIHVYAKTDAPDPPAAVHGNLLTTRHRSL